MERGTLIENALLRVGNMTDYNDNRSDIYKMTDRLLDNVISIICKSNEFSFNSTTVKLTESVRVSETGEYMYNIPVDFLGVKKKVVRNNPVSYRVESVAALVNAHIRQNFRIQGEYIYSFEKPLILNYVRTMILTEIPGYMEEYFTLMLAKQICLSVRMFADTLPFIEEQLRGERLNVILAEKNLVNLEVRNG